MGTAAPDPGKRLLSFRIAGARYGLAADRVSEVARMPKLARVPHAPPSLLGLANFRGAVLPVLSFAALANQPRGPEARVILLDGTNPVAIAVDEVNALVAIGTDDVRQIEIDALVAAQLGARSVRRSRGTGSVTAGAAASRTDEAPLVVFALGAQEFALPLGAVDEIVRLPGDVTLMPRGDAVVVGSIAVRGELLPLLSLAALLMLPARADTRARIVVVRIGGQRIGLVVDAMRAIIRVPESQIDPVPLVLSRGSAETRIQAICRLDGGKRLVSVLAPEQLLREDITARLLQGGKEQDIMAGQQVEIATEQFLLFRIGHDEFGLPIAAVDEVAPLPPKLTRVPKAPTFVQGIMNLRGNVVPVIDQVQRFGGVAASGKKRRVVFVRIGELQAGFIVDAVSEVMRVPVAALREAPEFGTDGTRVFDRVANLEGDGRIVLIVSPRELLDRAERDLLAAIAGKGAAGSE